MGEPGAPGRDGVAGLNGKDGRDGLSPDDLDWTFDAETRQLTVTLARDGVVLVSRTKQLLGVLMDRDVYDPHRAYVPGDVVTRDGLYWVAKESMQGITPGSGASGWRLAVKHGERGKVGPEGAAGRDGRDLTQVDSAGRKW